MSSTSPQNQEDATLLMNAAADGDKAAADRLLPLVYDQLRKAAQFDLVSERAGTSSAVTTFADYGCLPSVCSMR